MYFGFSTHSSASHIPAHILAIRISRTRSLDFVSKFLAFTRISLRVYPYSMQSSTNLDNYQAWGGQDFRYEDSATVHQESRPRPSSRVGFTASDSDEIFRPTSGEPSTRDYHLPPLPPRRTTYSQTATSYNNPSFVIPPHTPVPLLTRTFTRPLGPPPPIPPRIHSPSASSHTPTNIVHHP